MEEKEGNGQMQGTFRELSMHSLVLPDPMRSIRNLHIQQRKNHLQNEVLDGYEAHSESSKPSEPQEPNLILFTLLQGQQNITEEKSNEPKKQRSPRRRRSKNEW